MTLTSTAEKRGERDRARASGGSPKGRVWRENSRKSSRGGSTAQPKDLRKTVNKSFRVDSKGNVGREGTWDTSPGRGRTLRLAEKSSGGRAIGEVTIFFHRGRGNVGTPKISLTAGGTT